MGRRMVQVGRFEVTHLTHMTYVGQAAWRNG
jgi:hypothetical protein